MRLTALSVTSTYLNVAGNIANLRLYMYYSVAFGCLKLSCECVETVKLHLFLLMFPLSLRLWKP